MTVIGLTGGIASGKSTVAEHLRTLGATLIDADRVGHRSYEPGTPGFEKVVNAFGHEIVGKDGFVDRRVLGGKVFGAPGEMERLNAILWPEIRHLISEELRDLKRRDRNQIIVLEAAVLIEAGWTDLCDEIWVVTANQPIALARLMARNALTEEAALARIQAQAGTRERGLQIADVKLDNSGTEEQLAQRVDRAWKTLTKRLEAETGVKAPARLPARPVVKATSKRTPASKAPAAKAAASKAVAKPASKPAAKAAKPPAKTAAKAPARPVAKSAPKKAAVKPASKPAAKAAKAPARTAAKPAAKPVTKRPAAKPAAKAPARSAVKAAKPAPKKPAPKAAPKRPAAKPAAKATKAPARPAVKAGKAAAKGSPAARRR